MRRWTGLRPSRTSGSAGTRSRSSRNRGTRPHLLFYVYGLSCRCHLTLLSSVSALSSSAGWPLQHRLNSHPDYRVAGSSAPSSSGSFKILSLTYGDLFKAACGRRACQLSGSWYVSRMMTVSRPRGADTAALYLLPLHEFDEPVRGVCPPDRGSCSARLRR